MGDHFTRTIEKITLESKNSRISSEASEDALKKNIEESEKKCQDLQSKLEKYEMTQSNISVEVSKEKYKFESIMNEKEKLYEKLISENKELQMKIDDVNHL